jgi:transposase-like protein
MFNQIPEKKMHYVRWLLTIGWAVLIGSMFYDPLTAQLTNANNLWSPFHSGNECINFQGTCLQTEPYDMGARIFWGMIIPSSIVLIFLFGHEAWRRICPLSFIAQLPRALGLQNKRLAIKSTEDFSYDLVKVSKDSWLGRNYLYLQFFLLFIGLNIRLLLVNSDGLALGIYLVATILLAMGVNYWYGGKSWCHYICPMAPVQMVYTGPRGLLGSKAHEEKKSLTQSMCRTVDVEGEEKSACVGCKSSCLDIDIEKSYWEELHQPDKKILYYGYFGLVVGFYLYFFLYSGSLNYVAAGAWNETSQIETLFNPGFYIANHVIPIPKIVAVPLTLAATTGWSYIIGLQIEAVYKFFAKSSASTKLSASAQTQVPRRISGLFTQVQHRIFTAFAFLSFTVLFFLGIYPSLSWLPLPVQRAFTWLVVIASAAWFYRTLKRSAGQYARESRVHILRGSLDQLALDFPSVLEGRSLEELNAEEVYVLGKVVPDLFRDKKLLEEALVQKDAEPSVQRETLENVSQAREPRKQALAPSPTSPLAIHSVLICPRCSSARIGKNGRSDGKQRFICKDCRRQFVEFVGYAAETRQLCIRMHLNGLSFRAIERVTGISRATIMLWVKQAAQDLPQDPETSPKDTQVDKTPNI